MKNSKNSNLKNVFIYSALILSSIIVGFLMAPSGILPNRMLTGTTVGGFVLMAGAILSVRFRYSLQGHGRWYWSTWKKFPPNKFEKLSLFYGVLLLGASGLFIILKKMA